MSEALRSQLVENLRLVRERIEAACRRSDRSIDDVTLVAVSKYAEMEWVQVLVSLGVSHLGEARPQQLTSRAAQLPSHLHWHLIGHLQRNKAESVLGTNSLIHSVDSVRLFDHIAKLGANSPNRPRVLLEVNISGEASKDGFTVDDLLASWPHLSSSSSAEIAGLMTMAPLADDPESARPVFKALRELRDRLRVECNGSLALDELSMGMSGDFEVGIEEGATLIRVGSRLFEGLAEGSGH